MERERGGERDRRKEDREKERGSCKKREERGRERVWRFVKLNILKEINNNLILNYFKNIICYILFKIIFLFFWVILYYLGIVYTLSYFYFFNLDFESKYRMLYFMFVWFIYFLGYRGINILLFKVFFIFSKRVLRYIYGVRRSIFEFVKKI